MCSYSGRYGLWHCVFIYFLLSPFLITFLSVIVFTLFILYIFFHFVLSFPSLFTVKTGQLLFVLYNYNNLISLFLCILSYFKKEAGACSPFTGRMSLLLCPIYQMLNPSPYLNPPVFSSIPFPISMTFLRISSISSANLW